MSDTPKTVSKASWAKARVHTITLPSGAVVKIEVPSLPKLVKSGSLPNNLIDVAVKQSEADEVSRELLEQTWTFTEFLIPQMLVEPKITAEDVADLPALDLELLVQIASRQTDIDAVGHQLGGLETQDRFRKHRGFFDLDAALEGV